ncbi:MAG: TlpA family protein disulfide reductase [Psychroserpens sp.]|nr:TlpA family protein disulfide reductase [Psychroserpens sp.]
MDTKKFNRKKLANLSFIVIIVLMIIPQTRMPIQVGINRVFSNFVSPSELDVNAQKTLSDASWKLLNSSGVGVEFSEFKGKVVLVNFWATWCPPCIAEMPSFQELVDHFESNDDVVFLFVSNEDRSTIDGFMKRKQYGFETYQPISDPPQEFNVSSIPRTFLISREGRIVLDKTGAANWSGDAMIQLVEKQLKGLE